MTRNERMADFCFNGAKAITFTMIGSVLTGALSGQYANFDRDGLLLVGGIVVALALIAIVLLITGWLASPEDVKPAAQKSGPPHPAPLNSSFRNERSDILLFSPVEKCLNETRVRVSVDGDSVEHIALAVKVQRRP
ncbi:hypothetical protein U8Q05_12080 [Rhizobium ruizarguesonis]|nr:hypothetical protein U8Q05_12080 [Rhizobium ruizarguesonis]